MTSFSDHQTSSLCKALLIGDPGSGKTGALAALVKAGFNLYILDYDNGLDVLYHLLTPEERAQVNYITITDKVQIQGTKPIPVRPSSFSDGLKQLDAWAKDLTPQDVLVIDSFTFMSNAAMKAVLFLAGRLASTIQIQDYGEAMRMLEGVLDLLYSDALNCNVILTSHIAYIEDQQKVSHGYPNTLGQKLAPKMGRWFNTVLQCKVRGTGSAAKRILRTKSEGLIELKHPAPGKIKDEYPQESGLADIFAALRT